MTAPKTDLRTKAAPGDEPGASPRQGGVTDPPRLDTNATRYLGYLRVSTTQQGESGLGLADQRSRLTAHAHTEGWNLTIVEEVWTAKTAQRPGLEQVLDQLARGEAAGLVALNVARLSRSMADFSTLLARSGREGWRLVILDLNLDTATAQGRFVAHLMAAVAELEREMIADRTRHALDQARARGTRLGRPPSIPAEVVATILGLRGEGLGYDAIAARLDEQHIPTAAGGVRWHGTTVRKVILRSK